MSVLRSFIPLLYIFRLSEAVPHMNYCLWDEIADSNRYDRYRLDKKMPHHRGEVMTRHAA